MPDPVETSQDIEEIILSSAELQAVEDFTGASGNQDPRQWWMALAMAGRPPDTSPSSSHPSRIPKLFDMKMAGDAAVWADDTPKVATIVQTYLAQGGIKNLQQVCLA